MKFVTILPALFFVCSSSAQDLKSNEEKLCIAIRDNDVEAVKDSLSHTMYQNKPDAVQALREVLENGAYPGKAPDKDGKPIACNAFDI